MTGVYLLFHNRRVVYIGSTENWPARVSAHKGFKFDEAKILECKKTDLLRIEARMIRIFRPIQNRMHSGRKKKHKRITDEWVEANSEIIRKALSDGISAPVTKKAFRDLDFSHRSNMSDAYGTIVNTYARINNVELEYCDAIKNYIIAP